MKSERNIIMRKNYIAPQIDVTPLIGVVSICAASATKSMRTNGTSFDNESKFY